MKLRLMALMLVLTLLGLFVGPPHHIGRNAGDARSQRDHPQCPCGDTSGS